MTRRNEPCPCGSGARFKDCHGKIAADPGSIDALVRRALETHERGGVDEAQRLYGEILSRDPGNAVATHYTGLIAWQRGELARAEDLIRASLAADAGVADFHNNLALLLRDTGRAAEAVASLERAIGIAPQWGDARNNLGLALEAAGRWDEAIAAYHAAIERQPPFPAARQNLARALLAKGDFAAAWPHYRWRLVAQGAAADPPDAAATPLADSLAGRRFVLLSEQGLGDVLFFLRFAPALRRRGASLAFRGDGRLHTMLARTGLFDLGIEDEGAPRAGLEPLHLGDLPCLLGAADPGAFPPPLELTPEPRRVERMRERLAANGDAPYLAITWRGGLASAGPSITQLKRIEPALLGASLRGVPGTWISVQRLPPAGEREALAAALGRPVADFSDVNQDLEDMLALMSLAAEYVCVSNANVYLRTATGRGVHVLVPHPPEWRWGIAGERSAWFANARVYRQAASGDWTDALARLSAALTSAAAP